MSCFLVRLAKAYPKKFHLAPEEMYLTATLFPALLLGGGAAISGALAFENPHRHAATLRSRAPKPVAKPAAPLKRALSETSSFLNANSESEFVNGQLKTGRAVINTGF